jgi:hypothetical protein
MTEHARKRHLNLSPFLSLLMVRAATFSVQALTVGDYTYTTNSAGLATITDFSTAYTGTLSITNTLGGCPVVSIGANAFASCSRLAEVIIPESITNIGGQAFYRCTKLTNAVIPKSVVSMGARVFRNCDIMRSITVDALNPNYCSVDGVLFNKTQTEIIRYPGGKAGSYVIPDSVTTVVDMAFQNCDGLTDVIVPSSVSIVESYALDNCDILTGVFFKGNAPNISSTIFVNSANVTVYHLPTATGWPLIPGIWGGRTTAQWDGFSYILDINGGTGGGAYSNGQEVAIVANVPPGWMFVRWTGATQYVASVTSSNTTVTVSAQKITLTAIIVGNPHTVAFDSAGGTSPNPASKTVAYGSAYGTLATTTRPSYYFAGWYTNSACTGMPVANAIIVTIDSDHTLHAKWVAAGEKHRWLVADGGNGHWYEPVAVSKAISWSYASNQAARAGGYLATITSSQEQAFVWGIISTIDSLWSFDGGTHPGERPGPFIGGYQISGAAEPVGGWAWVTGEAFVYSNWSSGEPNNTAGGTENRIAFRNKGIFYSGSWNDVADFPADDVISFIIEYDSTTTSPVPVPYAWLDQYPALLGLAEGSYEAMALADVDGDGHAAWQEYVAGTVPTNGESTLHALIAVSNGMPWISWSPDLGTARVYMIEGSTNLTDAVWGPTNAGSRFFRVGVSLP